ncbi:MAG: thiamine pyrophosphate-dependent enzyme [SAR202 cluster bacterium]|nr:thiamine pyrophosphate-dependent enzyme [SAR202 cluster bacterium]
MELDVIGMMDALRLIEQRRGDAIVLTTMMGNLGWREVTHNEALDLPIGGAMGKASSVALGLCLAHPDKRVIVIDADGSLLMNLGTLVTVGGMAPENLYHFVLDNGMYAVTGGQPVPNSGCGDLAGLARAAGYPTSVGFDDLEDFTTRLDEVMGTRGPVLVSIKTEPAVFNSPSWTYPVGHIRFERQAIPEFIEALKT